MLSKLRSLAVALFLFASLASPGFAQQSLEVGQVRSGSVAPGDTVRFTFEAGDDFILYGEVEQIDADVVVSLVNEEGQQVGPVWDVTGRGAEALTAVLDEAGEYTLRVTAFEDEEGDFEIELFMLEAKAEDPAELADQLMYAYDREGSPGGALRVWRDGRTLFSKGYGLANLAYGIDFAPETPTNIGSTSKQFTAFAVLLEQERGNLSLDDDIREYFPDIPDFGETITIENLLTHTSGLREFLNLWVLAGMDARSLDRDDVLLAATRQPALQNAPGAEFNYNNTAFSLAAQIVEQTSGEDFDDYMRENVFGPLGMDDSYVRMTPETIVPGASEGYTAGADGWTAPGDLGGAVGAGGIYSSVEDLERWARNLADPVVGTPEMVEAMMTEYLLVDGEGSGYGYGLFIDEQRGLKRVHHGGADVSHRSMIVYYPEIDAGLTAQSNAASFGSQGTAFELGEAFFGSAMDPEEEAVAGTDADFDLESWSVEDFAPFEGTYTLDPAPQVQARFWHDGDTLRTQLTRQQPVTLRVVSPSSFEIVEVDARVEFEVEGEGDATGFTLFQGGQEIHATRMADEEVADAPEEWEPTPEELEEFTGRYFSEEIETFYTIRLEMPDEGGEEMEGDESDAEPQLIINQLHAGDMPMRPSERDVLIAGGGMTFEFQRDRAGRITGFYADVTRSRDIRFDRVR